MMRYVPMSASSSPYHLPAVKVKSPAVPSSCFQLDLTQRDSQVAAVIKIIVTKGSVCYVMYSLDSVNQ